MDESTIQTWSLLPSLGFQPDDTIVFSDIRPGLSLDFGNFKLSAVAVTSPCSGQIVLFTGVLAAPRTISEIQFELPRRVESLKQCAAWIVWHLDQQSDGRVFMPARAIDWVEEARRNRRLLPFVVSQAEYSARPQCGVQRDWLRLALKNLREELAPLPDDAIVDFGFDGAVFSIRCGTKLIAFPGDGLPWTVRFRVEAKTVRQKPKWRLMREYIGISIWNSRIELGPCFFEGTVEPLGACDSSSVQ